MDACVGRHVFAHVVHADIHQLHRIECAAAQMRCGGGVAGPPGEGEVDAGVRQAHRIIDAGKRGRVPRDRDIHIPERALAHHERLGGTAFLGRAAVIAHAAGQAVFRQPVLHRRCGKQRCGPQQIMPAAMAQSAARQRPRFGHAGFLAQPRQGVVFTQDRDHRPAFSGFAHHRSRDAGDVAGHAEPLRVQHRGVFGHRVMFIIGNFRIVPDPVAQGQEIGAFLVYQ